MMPFLTATVTDENDALATFAAQQIRQLATTLQGLDAEQIRATPTASGLSLALLARHVAVISTKGLLAQLGGNAEEASLAPDEYAAGGCQPEGVRAHDTADSLVAELESIAASVGEAIRSADLERRIPVPDAPWFPDDLDSWPARWVALHTVEEVARHTGHADIIRECIDGKTAYELNALADGEPWPPSYGG